MNIARIVCVLFLCTLAARAQGDGLPISGFRPPAVPLILSDTYFNIWSAADNLTDVDTTQWDAAQKNLTGLIRVDGVAYRWMGLYDNGSTPAMTQKSVTVYPTSTVYVLSAAGVELTVTFFTPLLTDSLELLSRPVTYLTLAAISTDETEHNVSLYFDIASNFVVSSTSEAVEWSRLTSAGGLNVMSIGSQAQNYLGNPGDAVSINWGFLLVAAPSSDPSMTQAITYASTARPSFVLRGTIPQSDATNQPAPASDNQVLAVVWNVQLSAAAKSPVRKTVLLAYDDVYSMYFFGQKMPPYWRILYDNDALAMLDDAWEEHSKLAGRCAESDGDLLRTMERAGGPEYASMIALTYRQVLAATKVVWNEEKKSAWYFMKEVSSDGDVSTVDVIFPASPFFLFHNPGLLGRLMIPVLEYANNATWHPYSLPWAPHHLGQWPVANITTDQQENMPVEETANMLLMIAAVVQMTGDASLIYPEYWPIIQGWGEYLVTVLPDPGDQLCTDDFEGPTPHDANLAAKGILGLGAYSILCEFVGDYQNQSQYIRIARQYVQDWIHLANQNNTDHFGLRYDEMGWSLKYNLLWQAILGLDLFPQSVFDMELAFYKTQMLPYGIPLDVRSNFTKIDWESWVATFDTAPGGFEALFAPLYKFANETPQRVPLTDWYWTDKGTLQGFINRPVVGAFWAQGVLSLA